MNIQKPQSKQPIPPEAECVFKGAIFDVYQWEQPQYDGSTKTFEKLKRPDTVLVIAVTPEQKILVSRQEQPGKPGAYMGLLGGRVDEGEEPLAAAKRELLEEGGMESQDWDIYFAFQPMSKVEWGVYCFVARGCKKIAEQQLDGGEKIEVLEVGFDEFVSVVTGEGFEGMSFTEAKLKMKVLEARLDPKKMEEFKKLLLG